VKLKQLPDDFQVEEQTAFAPDGGEFALYRLTKRSLGTPEAVDAVVRRWKLRREAVSFGGLKDKHAVTAQWITIRDGPRRDLKQAHLELAYQGQASRPLTPGDIAGNRFTIVVRDLAEPELEAVRRTLQRLGEDGLPNYFDRQRFGSLGGSGEFVARAWCLGDYPRALWLALADSCRSDRSREKAEKELLRTRWGDWSALAPLLPPHSMRRAAVEHLAQQPDDFRRALSRLPHELRSLYLAAFQSCVWNRMLAGLLRQRCRPEQLFDTSIDDQTLPFFHAIDEDQRAALRGECLPLPSARLRLEPGPIRSLVERALGPFGLELRQMRIKYPRDTFFSKGDRPVVFFPAGLTDAADADDLHTGRWKVALRFDLPRGCYATILVKRLAADRSLLTSGSA
jgi:tRNA pseudouridine13 synthase